VALAIWFETQYTACEDLRLSFEGLGDSANPRELLVCRISSLVLFNSSLASFGDAPELVDSFRAWEFEVCSCDLSLFPAVRLAFSAAAVSASHIVLPAP